MSIDFEPIDRLLAEQLDSWDGGDVLCRIHIEDRDEYAIVQATPTELPAQLVAAFDELGVDDPVESAKRTIRRPGWRASATCSADKLAYLQKVGRVAYCASASDGSAGWRKILRLTSTDGSTIINLDRPKVKDPSFDDF